MEDSQQLELIEKYNSKELYEKLLSWTIVCSNFLLGKKSLGLPKGQMYKDIIQDAFRRACQKRWSNLTEDVFRNYLFGAIKSIVSNLAKSPENTRMEQLVLVESENEEGDVKYKTQAEALSVESTIEQSIDRKIKIERIEKEIKGNKELESVWSGILIGMKDQEISNISEMPITIVRNTKKRLLRIIEKVSKAL